jgi:hypothetical protein
VICRSRRIERFERFNHILSTPRLALHENAFPLESEDTTLRPTVFDRMAEMDRENPP